MIFRTIPDGWGIKKMPQVVKWGSGGTPKATEKQYYDGGSIPWLVIGDLNDSIVSSSASKITELGLQNSSAKMIPAGTLLVAMYGSIGKLGITGIECCTNQAIAYAKELYGVTTKYMFFYMAMMKSELISKGKGGTQKNISQTVLNSLEVIVPPLPEQERIVARIEELFSQLDAGVETLKKTKAQLAVYRQAVLKEAFDSIEDQYYQTLNTAILGSPQNGLYKPKSDYSDNGTPILRIDGFYDGFIVKDYYYKRVNLTVDEITRYSLEIGDLIVNRVNSMPYLGKCALVRFLGETTVFESNMMRIKLDNEKVNGDFLTYYLSSSTGRKELTKSAKQAVNQASINQTDVGNAIVPMPPVEIQKRLLTYIESRLSVCDSIEHTVDTALQQAEAMRQSILKDAFEGKL